MNPKRWNLLRTAFLSVMTFVNSPAAGDAAPVGETRLGKGTWIENVSLSDTARNENGQAVKAAGTMLVYLPRGYHDGASLPLVIALHGWGQAAADWRANTDIAEFADRNHVVIVFPDMGKTVYEFHFYPETALRWNQVPGARWIGEVVLPFARNHYGVSKEPGRTAIIGVSTGGRGAVVVAEHYPEFSFCAGLSGTYDLSLPMPGEGEYKIHSVVFGHREDFRDRWKAEDCINPAYASSLKPVALFLAHGTDDMVVSEQQLESMRTFLKGFHANNQVVAVYKAEHGWLFWNSQLGALFDAMAVAFGERRATRQIH